MESAQSQEITLPEWAVVTPPRRAHIERVTWLLDRWAVDMELDAVERQAWHDAGRWHDALRDATTEELQRIADNPPLPHGVLHGPAAARMLRAEGETRNDVLHAIEFHTLGSGGFARVGKALYMADFLEPGRQFMARDRAFLAAAVPRDFDGVFRQVVRMRIEWTLREGKALYRETVELWNGVR